MNYLNEFEAFPALWLNNLIDAGEIPPAIVDTRSICDVLPEDVIRYRQCHWFCGIAGWPLALRLAGYEHLDSLWTGSCPCQPFSDAGKQLGAKDPRHLWPNFFGLIKACRPKYVFGEQVASAEIIGSRQEAAFFNAVQAGDFARANKLAKQLVANPSFSYDRRWVDGIFADMGSIGYTGRYAILGAHSVGSPHIRQRLFWGFVRNDGGLLNSNGDGRESGITSAETARYGDSADSAGSGIQRMGAGNARPAIGSTVYGESDCRMVNSTGSGRRTQSHEEQQAGGEYWTGAWSDYRIAQFRDGKQRRVESVFFKMVDGLPNSLGRVQPELVRILENEIMNYATTSQVDPGEAMRNLRNHIAEEAFQWTTGGLLSVQSPPVLLSFLCQLTQQGWRFQYEMARPIEDIRGKLVRGVWVSDEPAGASCGRRLPKQCHGESANAMRELSSLVARTASSAWTEAYDSHAKRASPLTNALPRSRSNSVERLAGRNRTGRLKAYGNAIVPQVAALFIRAFMESVGEVKS